MVEGPLVGNPGDPEKTRLLENHDFLGHRDFLGNHNPVQDGGIPGKCSRMPKSVRKTKNMSQSSMSQTSTTRPPTMTMPISAKTDEEPATTADVNGGAAVIAAKCLR